MTRSDIVVRRFTEDDADQLLELMKKLAEFEHYIQDFRVTKEDILERGFGHAPEFHAVVAASQDGCLQGMAVYYAVPYTYDLKPSVILKELYVRSEMQGKGIGHALMRAVVAFAREIHAGSITWLVMRGNKAAEAFYRNIGGRPDQKWDKWQLDRSAIHELI